MISHNSLNTLLNINNLNKTSVKPQILRKKFKKNSIEKNR